jgi:hypothetical protein
MSRLCESSGYGVVGSVVNLAKGACTPSMQKLCVAGPRTVGAMAFSINATTLESLASSFEGDIVWK